MARTLSRILAVGVVMYSVSVIGFGTIRSQKSKPAQATAEKVRRTATALPAGVSQHWFARAQQHIANEQRKVQTAPNGDVWVRARGLIATLNSAGAVLTPDKATESKIAWRWSWIEGLTLDDAKVGGSGRVVTVDRGPVRERFENRPDGLEHSLVIERRPSNSGLLQVHIPLSSPYSLAKPDPDKERIEFRDVTGKVALEYRDLKVFDSTKRVLESSMEPDAGGILISVRDEGAVYPVTVDPVLSDSGVDAADFERFAYTDDQSVIQEFGFTVAGAGDVNGDTFPDVVVGAPGFDRPQEEDIGAAYVWLGIDPADGGGLQLLPAWTMEGQSAGSRFGYSVAGGGDMDGLGMDDILVGAPGELNDQGRVYLFMGQAAPTPVPAIPLWTWGGGTEAEDGAQYGFSVAWMGDVNGDGNDDFVVGSPYRESATNTDAGQVDFYFGEDPGTGPQPGVIWTSSGPDQEDAWYGFSVTNPMDVDGDLDPDLLVGAPGFDVGTDTDAGAAFVHEWDGADFDAVIWDSQARGVIEPGMMFGYSVAGPGNITGDTTGFPFFFPLNDILVGAPGLTVGSDAEVGAAYLFTGDVAVGVDDVEAWSDSGNEQAGAQFGFAVAGAGDVNDDGVLDVVIGSPGYDFTFNQQSMTDAGRVYVYLGIGFPIFNLAAAPEVAYSGGLPNSAARASARLGSSVAGVGDISGGGNPDVLFGSPGWDYEAAASFALSDGVGILIGLLGETIEAGLPPIFTWDEWPPNYFVIGNRRFDSQFGSSVAGGFDLNADGYYDVVVGDRAAITRDGATGAIYVYMGTETGLPENPTVVVDGSLDGDYQLTGWNFGTLVVNVGNVDADPSPEFAVTAPGEQTVYIFSWPNDELVLRSTLSNPDEGNEFGFAVAGGNLNDDDYSDVIVGAPGTDVFVPNGPPPWGGGTWYEQTGVAWVFWGASGGPDNGDSTVVLSNIYINGPGFQTDSRFGASLATGDLNGDGIADLAVGWPTYDTIDTPTLVDTGAVICIQGAADFDEDQDLLAVMGPYTEEGARYGTSIAIGNIDGQDNGVAEIMMGAPGLNGGEGAVHIFNFTSWPTVDPADINLVVDNPSGVADDGFGTQVVYTGVTTGDENGNFAVTAPFWVNAEEDMVGRAYLFSRNGSGTYAVQVESQTSGDPEWNGQGPIFIARGGFIDDPLSQVRFDDLIIGFPQFSRGLGLEGRIAGYFAE